MTFLKVISCGLWPTRLVRSYIYSILNWRGMMRRSNSSRIYGMNYCKCIHTYINKHTYSHTYTHSLSFSLSSYASNAICGLRIWRHPQLDKDTILVCYASYSSWYFCNPIDHVHIDREFHFLFALFYMSRCFLIYLFCCLWFTEVRNTIVVEESVIHVHLKKAAHTVRNSVIPVLAQVSWIRMCKSGYKLIKISILLSLACKKVFCQIQSSWILLDASFFDLCTSMSTC